MSERPPPASRREQEPHARSVLTLVSADPDAMIVSDAAGVVRFVNMAACQLFGQAADDLIGERLGFSVAQGSTAEINIVAGSRSLTGEMRTVAIDWEGAPATLAVIRDITERRQLLEQLHEAQKLEALGRLAGGVAHDFNNLLGVMLANAELLGDVVPDDEEARLLLKQIDRAGERATAITRQLLRFCRKSPARPQHIDLNALISESLQVAGPVLGFGINLRVDLDDRLGTVFIDPAQAEQVLLSLLLNACDALRDGGTITVATGRADPPAGLPAGGPAARPAGPPAGGPGAPPPGDADPPVATGDYVAITISDDGVGMSEDVRDRIFEPFFTTKTRGRGTGLGLAAASGIVAQAGGAITVDSSPGEGATFTVLLPGTDQPPAATAPPGPEPPAYGSGTILVAEDEANLRRVIARMLEAAGFTVLQAADGAEALAVAREQPFDVLLTDILMPGVNGYGAAEEILARWPHRSVVFMTGFPDEPENPQLIARGTGILTKPFTRAELLRVIHAAARRAAVHADGGHDDARPRGGPRPASGPGSVSSGAQSAPGSVSPGPQSAPPPEPSG